MRAIFLIGTLLAMFVSSSSVAQGHYEADPTQTTTIQRSHEYKAEGKEFERVVPTNFFESG